ncbi:MAG: hypothetical protein K5662_00905 [Lachnospiraceae bacterium]|nr:hypothetical protein [Lachnospiraceae bacterium]
MRRNISGINIGSSSLLLIFVVLSLVSFAVLSLSSATADRKLEQKALDHTYAYYNACNEAEEEYAVYDRKVRASYRLGLELPQPYSFTEYINDTQELHVCIEAHEPDESGNLTTITEWRIVNVNIPEIDEHLNVFE